MTPTDDSLAYMTLKDLSVGSPENMVQEVLDDHGFSMDDVLMVWASPPCETMSRADSSLTTRGLNSRDWAHPERPPRSQDAEDPVTARALLHDTFMPRLQQMLAADRWRGHDYAFVIENPGGGASMGRRPYAQVQCWPANVAVQKHTVELCAYHHPLRKTTDLWCGGTSLATYQPQGATGDGRCHQRCPLGKFTQDGHYRHPYALGEDPARMPKGPGAGALTHAMPTRLHNEILDHAQTAAPQRRVVIDLFAGHRSLYEACQAKDLIYIPVDYVTRKRRS